MKLQSRLLQVNRMLVVGRDALHRVAEDFAKKHVDLERSDMTDK